MSGSEPLEIEGQVEGSILFSGNHVSIGRDALVAAKVIAQEIAIRLKGGAGVHVSQHVVNRPEKIGATVVDSTREGRTKNQGLRTNRRVVAYLDAVFLSTNEYAACSIQIIKSSALVSSNW